VLFEFLRVEWPMQTGTNSYANARTHFFRAWIYIQVRSYLQRTLRRSHEDKDVDSS
jgi:hypothetical protein